MNLKKSWKELLIKMALVLAAVILYLGAKSYIYKDVGYEQDEEIQFTALHFMMMGLNEKTTGSYDGWDVAISGNVPLLKDRTQKQLEVIEERLKEKGFWGYMNFLLKKNVMTFNDGTFGWGREGNYTYNVYPVYSDGKYAHFVQKVFLPELEYGKQFNTYSQFVWLLIIFCIPGICLIKKEKRELCLPVMVAFIGIVLYLMLFEARARYLICFLPVLIMISGIGIGQYYELIDKFCKKSTIIR